MHKPLFQDSVYLVLRTILGGRHHHYLDFMDEKIEARFPKVMWLMNERTWP